MIITKFPFLRHLRSEPSSHVMRYRGGKLVASGRGLSLWFHPLSTSMEEVPCDDMEQVFLFHGRSSDFQDITTQGVITFRVRDPELAAERFDFSVDQGTGLFHKEPIEQISALLTRKAQELANGYLAHTPVRRILTDGVEELSERIQVGLIGADDLEAAGLEVITLQVSKIAPTSELEKALQAPQREAIQTVSDEAVFQRRALAVEKERAIAENELQNQIELAKREEDLIAQAGLNEQRRVREEAEANRVAAESQAEVARFASDAKAAGIQAIEEARVDAEQNRMAIYRDMPQQVLMGLALQEMAKNIGGIEHLSLTPELIGSLIERLAGAGARKLEAEQK